ncbi:unnamed protein product [Closterium sp. NIES-54]
MPGSGGTHRCRGQHLHLADAQRTTHEAAGRRGSHYCAAAAGADHHRSHSSVQLRDQLHHYLCRLRHLLRLRHHRRRTTATASTAAADTSTSTTTPTTTPTPSTASTTTSTAPATPTSAPAPLAPASAAAPSRGRRSIERLETTEVGRSSRSNRGQEGGGGTPLKDRGARVTTRGSYNDYAVLGREETLLEEVNGECGGAN